jgi:hypothetical protein
MPDPLTLGVVGGWAALEGIKFLYGQAAELLKAWRERRSDAPDDSLAVPVIHSEVLDAPVTSSEVNAELLRQERDAIGRLAGALAPYAQGLLDIDPDDADLADNAGRMRAMLEGVYGQRFTFRGEDRDPTGTRVTIKQVLGDVKGQATGAEGNVRSGQLAVDQRADSVEGSITGFKGDIGAT